MHLQRISPRTHENAMYSAFVGSLASFRGYLNKEFNRVVVELASTHQWRVLSLPVATFPTSIDTDKVAPSRLGWIDVEHKLVTEHGRPPSALLFVLKFHWNYGVLAQLGRRHDRHTTDSNM